MTKSISRSTTSRTIGVIDSDQYASWLLSDEKSIRRIGFRDYHSPLYGEEEWTSWNVIKEVAERTYKVAGRDISGERLILDEKGDVVIETGVDVGLVEKIKEIISNFLSDENYKRYSQKRKCKNMEKGSGAL